MKNSVDVERQGWTNAQYPHREYLQIAGIPTSIAELNLEEKICEIFEATGVSAARMILTIVTGFEIRNER